MFGNFTRRKFLFIALIILVPIIIGALAYFFLYSQNKGPANSKIIAKVGDESLFQKDFEVEYTSFPKSGSSLSDKQVKDMLVAKMIRDSVILQGAAEENMVSLDQSVFNTYSKDYYKRTRLVASAEALLKKQEGKLEGSRLAMYIFNVAFGRNGYAKSKEMAMSKMRALYEQVRLRKITMQQAAEKIRADEFLSGNDVNYKGNAYFEFKAGKGEKITSFPEFDSMIQKLNLGEITSLYVAKDKHPVTKEPIDAIVMFAEVTRVPVGIQKTFDEWYAEKSGQYEVKIY